MSNRYQDDLNYYQPIILVSKSYLERSEIEDYLFSLYKDFEVNKDLNFIEPEKIKSISVDQIRNLSLEISKKNIDNRIKFFIIRSHEELGHVPQNALLKLLEEPNSNIILVIVVSDVESVLPTIRSRCNVIYLKSEGGATSLSDFDMLAALASEGEISLPIRSESFDPKIIEAGILLKILDKSVDQKKLNRLDIFDRWTR